MPSKCCCFDLKTGSLLIGSTDLFLNVLFLIVSSITFNTVPLLLTLLVISTLLPIIASIWLIVGIKQDKPGYVVLWIIMKAFAIVLMFFSLIAFTYMLFIGTGLGGGSMAVPLVFGICAILFFCLNVYWWFVVRSYQQELRARTAANFA
ncbi:hypothetical protein ACFFRR_002889 [Megaselia abdita]